MVRWTFGNGTLGLTQGDITLFNGDAVVNAANSGLRGGGGVDGAIHRAAGPELPEACREWVAEHGPLPAGQAMVTPGFNMAARYIIHTVGPYWRGGSVNERQLLRSAYGLSLKEAARVEAASVAFPAISTGVYGFPVELAAPIALDTLRNGLISSLVTKAVQFVYSDNAYNIWFQAAVELFGPPEVNH